MTLGDAINLLLHRTGIGVDGDANSLSLQQRIQTRSIKLSITQRPLSIAHFGPKVLLKPTHCFVIIV
jgi:hypothetical protein